MNIEPQVIKTTDTKNQTIKNPQNLDLDANFAEELKAPAENNNLQDKTQAEVIKTEQNKNPLLENINLNIKNNKNDFCNKKTIQNESFKQEEFVTETKNLDFFKEKNLNEALEGLSSIVQEFNHTEENLNKSIKKEEILTDKNDVINNDFNIQDNKDILPQMNPNMNFSGNGQPFSSFMNNDSDETQKPNVILGTTTQDLAEEAAILSTMAENIALANKNQILKDSRTITNEEGIKKIDAQTGIKIENIVRFDNIIMNQADVEVFVNIVENKEISIENLTPQATEKSFKISKTLAKLLAKSMENNQPVRIDFDNDISVIIRISRDGKITADFLPSSQVAEAYLKENLPLLRQRFDENNIEYDSLNQRERKGQNKDSNRKKDRNNE